VVIEGGRIVDGTGNAWFYGDVAITRDRMRASLRGRVAQRDRAAAGRRAWPVVAPGFIDIQGQSTDELLFGDGRVSAK